ncbi:MAG: SLC13 family permease [Bacteroidetes bacterium]|nr:SLC13 family permease [Bacteroidota bacterium]
MTGFNVSKKAGGLVLAFSLFLIIIIFFDFQPENPKVTVAAAVALLMSVLWISEAIPLAVTSLIPMVLFPFLGLLSGKETATAYVNSTIFLFMGGFIIAIAMEKWNLHKRIALNLISIFGVKPQRIILGFMIAAAFISMWISNTATAVMLLPIAMAILKKIEESGNGDRKFAVALMLGIAYACSVGGIGTLIGTPPNLVFQRIYSITFPDKPEIVFSQWMMYGVPLSITMLTIIYLLLTKVLFKFKNQNTLDPNMIRDERNKLGAMTREEKLVAIVFASTALLWMLRADLNLGSFSLPGWSNLIPFPELVDDGTVAILMSIILFMLPAKSNGENGGSLLGLETFKKIPWDIILLFGGGFALARGFVSSGLSTFLGSQLAGLANVPPIVVILIICLTISFMTELTSNTAINDMVLPILAALAVTINIQPELLMIPATISASMAFMMPVATPPNAIVFGSGKLRVKDMARAGIMLNFIGAVIITLFSYYFVDKIF